MEGVDEGQSAKVPYMPVGLGTGITATRRDVRGVQLLVSAVPSALPWRSWR